MLSLKSDIARDRGERKLDLILSPQVVKSFVREQPAMLQTLAGTTWN